VSYKEKALVTQAAVVQGSDDGFACAGRGDDQVPVAIVNDPLDIEAF
jgi:hypothetical protein